MGRKFHIRIFTNILFCAVVTGLIEVFLVTNLSMLAEYTISQGKANAVAVRIAESDAIVVLLYVLAGIAIFSAVFMLLQEKTIRYICRISDTIEKISEGDLNIKVEVVGDDELSGMAENLNKMAAELRDLMDREREAERTKNELITNVAHDLRTPLTSIIGYLELLSGKTSLPPQMQ